MNDMTARGAMGAEDRYKAGVIPYKKMGYWQPD